MRYPLLLLLLLHTATAQEPDPDSEFFEAPDTAIDFPACFRNIANADKNGDGVLKKNEYLGFIQEYSMEQKCRENPVLTFDQALAFNQIACSCSSIPGAASDCCVGGNAEMLTAGAGSRSRTGTQNAYLISACRVTDETLDPPICDPVDADRDRGPLPGQPGVFAIPPSPRTAGGDDGFPDWAIWTIIAAIALLLLMCCCCMCVYRRKKEKQEEEEEEEIIVGKGEPGEVSVF